VLGIESAAADLAREISNYASMHRRQGRENHREMANPLFFPLWDDFVSQLV
jgi:hypothetical protein